MMGSPAIPGSDQSLATRIARAAVAVSLKTLPGEVTEKVKLCLFDFVGCAFEARDLPWSRQAVLVADRVAAGETGAATVIGSPYAASYTDAAFANAVMGHGLVREDMHSGSISHLGVVVLPTLLALAQYRRVNGRDFIAATAVGYEVGGQIGRAVMDAELARIFRPTGITGPVGAAAAGARMLGLDADQVTSAVALGANTTAGFNQWAHTGGSEMFFHVGFAARNAVTAVRLAELGAFASPSALDGEAGLFAALGKPSAGSKVKLFEQPAEILSVYHKPVPACNFAQTACQAALRIARDKQPAPARIAAIVVRVPRAGAAYPGCDFTGPFAHILQAKMSIQYNVAAALIKGSVSEQNFTLLNDPALQRLISVITLEVDDEMTQAYPHKQGGEVEVRLVDNERHRMRLDNVVNATAVDVRDRFRMAAESAVGPRLMREIESFIDGLDQSDDVGRLGMLLRSTASE
jgi:2-methylcitrate dehydratase PrpD